MARACTANDKAPETRPGALRIIITKRTGHRSVLGFAYGGHRGRGPDGHQKTRACYHGMGINTTPQHDKRRIARASRYREARAPDGHQERGPERKYCSTQFYLASRSVSGAACPCPGHKVRPAPRVLEAWPAATTWIEKHTAAHRVQHSPCRRHREARAGIQTDAGHKRHHGAQWTHTPPYDIVAGSGGVVQGPDSRGTAHHFRLPDGGMSAPFAVHFRA